MDAYILVGGKSSRFGSAKAFAEIDGVSLAKRTLKTLTAAGLFSRITFVAANDAQFAIPAVALGARFVFDIYPGRGPLSGLHAALVDAEREWIFVTACDYPFVTVEMVRVLNGEISEEFDAVVPEQSDGRLQPLFAFYRSGPALRLVADLVEGKRSAPPMMEIVDSLTPRIVTFAEYSHVAGAMQMFTNINTPDDLAASRRNL